MDHQRAIREAIREHNAEIGVQAFACAAVGLIGTVIAVVFVGWLTSSAASGMGLRRWLILTAGVCAVLFLIGFLSARKQGGSDGVNKRVEDAAGGDFYQSMPLLIQTDLLEAGCLWWALHGPYAFVEAWGMLRGRLPSSDVTVRAAAELLLQLADGEPKGVSRELPREGLFTLLQLRLARPEGRAVSLPRVVITEKGKDLVLGRSQ